MLMEENGLLPFLEENLIHVGYTRYDLDEISIILTLGPLASLSSHDAIWYANILYLLPLVVGNDWRTI